MIFGLYFTFCFEHKVQRTYNELALLPPPCQAMLDAHDTIAIKTYEPTEPEPEVKPPSTPPANGVLPDAIRMVGLRKSPNEPLGVTVQVDNGELVIARILGGGMIDRQGSNQFGVANPFFKKFLNFSVIFII